MSRTPRKETLGQVTRLSWLERLISQLKHIECVQGFCGHNVMYKQRLSKAVIGGSVRVRAYEYFCCHHGELAREDHDELVRRERREAEGQEVA